MEIFEYDILSDSRQNDLVTKVNKLMKIEISGKKWIPQGGISTSVSTTNRYLHRQAMILVNKKEEKEEL